ncbi:MAG: phage portal protein [Caulobacteraceae bacterium]|nr:phage portal protein [Caulobacteraceae bacterium]
MGLFRRQPEQRAVTAGDILAAINDRRSGNMAGPSVTNESAMRLSAVWACVRLIAGVGSTLPLDVYRTQGDAQTQLAKPSLFVQPSPDMTLSTWLYQLWSSLLTAGNAYGLVTATGANGWPTTVELVNPAAVSWSEQDGEWVTKVDNVTLARWPIGPLFHVPLFTMAGCPWGMSPVQSAKAAIAAGLSAEQFGSSFFNAGGNPNAIIYAESELSADQAEGIKSAFVNATAGSSREPAVMGAGLRYERVQVSPDEAQFLDAQRFTVEQVARIYGVFPEMIGGATSGSSVTYANREQRAADWLTFGLLPYLIPIEESLSTLVPRPQRVRFNTGGLLRSDTKTRYETHAIGIASQFLTVDEARALEDLAPIGTPAPPAAPPGVAP